MTLVGYLIVSIGAVLLLASTLAGRVIGALLIVWGAGLVKLVRDKKGGRRGQG